eukprot:symbB.v1.2.024843.t1/scaffold2378.1/size80641/2
MHRTCVGRDVALRDLDRIPQGAKDVFLVSPRGAGAGVLTPGFLQKWRAISGLRRVPATNFKMCSINIALHVRRGDITQRSFSTRFVKDKVQITFHGKKTHKAHPAPVENTRGILLYPRERFESSSAMTSHAYQEQSQSEAESAQVPIPLPAALDLPDWTRSSQERERPEDDQAEDDHMIPIPTTQSLEEDWKISVQKAFDDPTRTKAPCEIPEANTFRLVNTVSKRQYDSFIRVLSSRNPTTPQEVIGNMASIFAQSGKMTRTQAEGSYTFEVPNSLGFGPFVPTYFKMREPFQNNDSNVYHILHGTTNKGASLILAEELIRPGDFTINKNLSKCGYPSYGFYSAGEVAAKTVQFFSSLRELSRKILKIGKGTLPVLIGGIYTGRYPRINQMSGGNEEIQRLCGEHGAARGKEKYLVARSEHTTVHGVVITYKNGSTPQQEAQAPEGKTPSPPNRIQSPLQAAFQGNHPVAFDPAQLLVTLGGTNQWLENNMPESFSDSKYKAWFKALKLDITSRQTVERNIVAMDNWWQNQPEAAVSTIHRV